MQALAATRPAHAGALFALLAWAAATQAADPVAPMGDPPQCQTVRLSDIGWTDVTATTAVFSALLKRSATSRQSRCSRCR